MRGLDCLSIRLVVLLHDVLPILGLVAVMFFELVVLLWFTSIEMDMFTLFLALLEEAFLEWLKIFLCLVQCHSAT